MAGTVFQTQLVFGALDGLEEASSQPSWGHRRPFSQLWGEVEWKNAKTSPISSPKLEQSCP